MRADISCKVVALSFWKLRKSFFNRPSVRSLVFFCIAITTVTSLEANPAEECVRASRFAAHEVGIPANVLLAVAKTETGRLQNGVTRPWPWSINIRGVGQWFENEGELLEASLEQIALGETLFDLGCFQINYRWHGGNFSSIDEMISPRGNALYAAQFLKTLFAEFKNWTDAVGAYHSRTEELSEVYKAKFIGHYKDGPDANVRNAARLSEEKVPSKKRENTFPLLQSADLKPQLGSLVPRALQ